MKKILVTALMLASSIEFSAQAMSADTDSEHTYKGVKTQAEIEYKAAHAKCESLADNAKDVCVAEAKARRVHSEQTAEAIFVNTISARASARKKIAEAEYDLDKAKCGALVGNDKDICVKKAKSVKVASIATAKADKKVLDARKDEAGDKKDAEYKVAIEKCDAMNGVAKDSCIAAAKTKYGK